MSIETIRVLTESVPAYLYSSSRRVPQLAQNMSRSSLLPELRATSTPVLPRTWTYHALRKKPPPAAVHPRENGSLHICSRLNTCADKRSMYAHTQAQESSSKGPENAPTEAHSPMRSWAPRGGGDRAPRAGGPPLSRTRGHREPARHLRYVRRRVAV